MSTHLKKLPPKSYQVAKGDVVGGLIYVMDKPLGIEEGMVGISKDSPAYLQFIQEQMALLIEVAKDPKKSHLTDPKMQQRFAKIYKRYPDFNSLPLQRQLNILIEDKKHVKKRYPMKASELKKIFFSFGKLHEVKGLQPYYENKGMGGLLFNAYCDKCEIKKNEHFASQIGKLIKDNNKVYMVKQDGKMAFGGTGPGWQRILKTTTGKSLQRLANPFVILLTGGLSAIAFGAILVGWRAFYLRKNKPSSANSDAIVETLATKIAKIRGFKAQEIETIDGTYPDGTPKIATIVTWTPGCKDLTDKLAGGESDYSSVLVVRDKNNHMIKVDKEGNIYRIAENSDDKKPIYEKILPDGSMTPSTKAEYNQALAVSEERVYGMGQSLLSFIVMGDRDGIGKKGQNKAIIPMVPPVDDYLFQFYGIDFGKAYQRENPVIQSLKDDFSFTNPSSITQRFVNISMLYDNPLRDKMKGVYLLMALRGQLSQEEKEAIAKEYESSQDILFAEKLRTYPQSVGGVNSDLELIRQEQRKYEQLANDATDSKKKEQYLHYAQRVKNVQEIMQSTDDHVFKVFAKRAHLTPSQIDILDNLEKLCAKNAYTTSPDGTVLLNHLRVEPQDRVAWQMEKNPDGSFNLVCEGDNHQEIKKRLAKIQDPVLAPLLNSAVIDKEKLCLKNLSAAQLTILSTQLTEERVAKTYPQLIYRTLEQKRNYYQRIQPKTGARSSPAPYSGEGQKHESLPPSVQPPKAHASVQEARVEPIDHLYQASIAQPSVDTSSTVDTANKMEDLVKFLADEHHKQALQITEVNPVKIGKYTPTPGLAVTFSEQPHQVKLYAQESPQNQSVQFLTPKSLSQAELEAAVVHICILAIQMAQMNDQIDLSTTPASKKEAFAKGFMAAIDQAVKDGRFTESTKPHIIGATEYTSALKVH